MLKYLEKIFILILLLGCTLAQNNQEGSGGGNHGNPSNSEGKYPWDKSKAGKKEKIDDTPSTDYQDVEPPYLTNWGKWGNWSQCRNNQYVQGFAIRQEVDQGPYGDDTALNALRLYCGDPFKPNKQFTQELISAEGKRGHWSNFYSWRECSRRRFPFFTAFSLIAEKPNEYQDDAGTVGVTFYCEFKAKASRVLVAPYGYGESSNVAKCKWGYAICGFQTQVEPYHTMTDTDNTALNRIKIRCCRMPQYNQILSNLASGFGPNGSHESLEH